MKRLGRYVLKKQLGTGAFGEVYCATYVAALGFEKKVAIKLLQDYLGDVQEQSRRDLKNEAHIGSLLHHPNIVDVFDISEENGRLYIVMEYIEGPTVLDLFQYYGSLNPFPLQQLMREVLRALHYAHNFTKNNTLHPVIHRDIKPSNIMLTPDGQVKLVDFGLAKAIGITEHTEGNIRGTPSYLSPEQAFAQPLDVRTDLFSLGLVIYELATGQKIIPNEDLIRTLVFLQSVTQDEIDAKIEKIPSAYEPFRPVLSKLLQLNPDDRYSSSWDALLDLNKISFKKSKNLLSLTQQWLSTEQPSLDHSSKFGEEESEEIFSEAEDTDGTLVERRINAAAQPLHRRSLSLESLSEAERLVLEQLIVFPVDFSLEAAEQIVQLEGDERLYWKVDIMRKLVSLSLLDTIERAAEFRLLLPKAIKEEIRRITSDTDLTPVHRRHAKFYAQWGLPLGQHVLETRDLARSVLLRDLDEPNLVSAFHWSQKNNEIDLAAQNGIALLRLQGVRQNPALSKKYYEQMMLLPALPAVYKGQALSIHAHLRYEMGSYAEAETLLREALKLLWEHQDLLSWIDTQHLLALTCIRQGKYAQGEQGLLRAKELAKKIASTYQTAVCKSHVGFLYVQAGAWDRGIKYAHQSMQVLLKYNDLLGVKRVLGILVQAHFQKHNYELAEELCSKALRASRKIGVNNERATLWRWLGLISIAEGQTERASACFATAAKKMKESKSYAELGVLYANWAHLQVGLGLLDSARRYVENAQQLQQHFSIVEMDLAINTARILLALENDLPTEALNVARQNLALLQQFQFRYLLPEMHFYVVQACVLNKDWSQAQSAKRQCETIAAEINNTTQQIYAGLAEYWLCVQEPEKLRKALHKVERLVKFDHRFHPEFQYHLQRCRRMIEPGR